MSPRPSLILRPLCLALLLVLTWPAIGVPADAPAQTVITGEQLDPATYGPGYIESMAAVAARGRYMPRPLPKGRFGSPGSWAVPTLGATSNARGRHNVANKWGDPHMAIGFPGPVDVIGVYVAGQADESTWTTGLRVVGFREGRELAASDWFREIGTEPRWLELGLVGVDRIEIEAEPVLDGAGWYALDDLTYRKADADSAAGMVVVGFEDVAYDTDLTDSGYAGLTWERGRGEYTSGEDVHAPRRPVPAPTLRSEAQPSDTRAVGPDLVRKFQAVIKGDADSNSYPPDTDGAIGPSHYVETVNRNFAVYNKTTGAELMNVTLGSFLQYSNGDPRVLFDHHSQRWIVLVTDFSTSATHFLAVSRTNNPMGEWFKTSFQTAQGSDAGRWPDYPTLGVDANGIYTASYMVGGSNSMTIFAIHKAPLIAATPSLGTITAFRGLPWEGAIQPTHTYGTGPAWFVSAQDSTHLRIRQISGALTNPTLVEVGSVTVPTYTQAPNAPALGSSTPLNTVDERPMMAVYRSGTLWTAHTIAVNGRAGCRWYQINVPACTVRQSGTVADALWCYFFPSIMVNADGSAVMGFTGSHAGVYASCFYTGRRSGDPLGNMATPVKYYDGLGPQNNVDSYGRNRWGDYSYTTLDPVNSTMFWTIQEYGDVDNKWGTYVAALRMEIVDCDDNGISDSCDIDCGPPGGGCDVPGCGTATDCNGNAIPDRCESTEDCNGNGIIDFCELLGGAPDCNHNGIPDECDLASGFSADCNNNGQIDECELGMNPRTFTWNLDTDPGWERTGEWAFGVPLGQGGVGHGHPDPTAGFTGANVFGVNLAGDYSTAIGGPYGLTIGPLDLRFADTLTLQYRRWLNTDYDPYVWTRVQVSSDGTNWTDVWTSGSQVIAESAWSLHELDLAPITHKATAYIRWMYQMRNGPLAFSGWNIDDVKLSGTFAGGGLLDCNFNVRPDTCDLADGTSYDCNGNSVPDECDIAAGTSQDANGDGVPDECPQVCRGDCDCDGTVGFADIDYFVTAIPQNPAAWAAAYAAAHGGAAPPCSFANCDVNANGVVGFDDIDTFVALIPSTCP